ncbi:TPA: hypothetical protein JG871_003920 [Enterobacter hormaechei subsp. xiangfangensis]|nr:hypothetical protein [Enterobacter hormaechei subsp. xiangfangensis]
MKNHKGNADKLLPYLTKMLAGHTLTPDDNNDRQQLARVADGIRSVLYVPVQTVRIEGGIIGYSITRADAREYIDNRPEQEARQRRVIEHAQNQRDARRAKALFARLNIPLPAEVAALARGRDERDDVVAELVQVDQRQSA